MKLAEKEEGNIPENNVHETVVNGLNDEFALEVGVDDVETKVWAVGRSTSTTTSNTTAF